MIDEATALRSVPPLRCTTSVPGACRPLDLVPTKALHKTSTEGGPCRGAPMHMRRQRRNSVGKTRQRNVRQALAIMRCSAIRARGSRRPWQTDHPAASRLPGASTRYRAASSSGTRTGRRWPTSTRARTRPKCQAKVLTADEALQRHPVGRFRESAVDRDHQPHQLVVVPGVNRSI
jgi:hypothetical protein